MRQPLGIAIVGGLVLSQMLTLVHDAGGLSLSDRFGRWCRRQRVGAECGAAWRGVGRVDDMKLPDIKLLAMTAVFALAERLHGRPGLRATLSGDTCRVQGSGQLETGATHG